jgi:hypothetical protein
LKKQFYPLLSILIIFLVAYLPLTSFLFALKNDMFIGYLPPKYLMGETISSGQLPLWNPYISFGLPFYGDMSSGYWNPITWIIAATTGYNAYTLTAEVMLYIVLSGAGMYYLSGLYTTNKYIRLIAAVSFMCNGFIVGHLQHINWLSGAAFLPWSLWSLKKMYAQPSLLSICRASLLLYLLASSSHPGIIIGSIYFFLAYVIFHLVREYKTGQKLLFIKNIKLNAVLLLALVPLSAGMIAGYLDIIPHFERSEQIDINLSVTENTGFSSWISSLLPFSTTTNTGFFSGDIAFRNIYWGLVLFIFFCLSIIAKKTKEQVFFLVTGSLFLLLSLGQEFKLAAIKILPLIGYVRVNAEFRIFAILSFTITAVIAIDKLQNPDVSMQKRLKQIIHWLLFTLSLLVTGSLVLLFLNRESLIFNLQEPGIHLYLREYLKIAIKQFSIYDTLIIQGSAQLLFLFFVYKAVKKRDFKTLFIITTFDVILATLLNVPYTGVGKSSVADIARIQQKSPRGIPVPPLQPITANDTIPLNERILFGEWSFYHKQIGSDKLILYPVKLKSNYLYYSKSKKDSSLSVSHLPFLFGTDSLYEEKIIKKSNLALKSIQSYTTNEIIINPDSASSNYLILLQNNYPHWYYQQNNTIKPVLKAGITFMAVPVLKEKSTVRIFFNPVRIKFLLLTSAIAFILYVIASLCSFRKLA